MVRAREGHALGGYEVDWSRPDGSKVPVALGISPIRDGDVVRGISIFGQDITERRRAAAALEKAREEAMESSRLKSEFLATMSHEIRTPMNGVIGLTSLLLDTELDTSQRQYADGVQAAGEALLSVINDILDFSKLDAGKVVLDLADFDPRRLVEDVGALLAPAAFSKQLELVAYCLPDVPRTVRGDPGRIRQILLNLASNAVKFTSEGEVAISVKSLPLTDGQVTLRFEVTDSGIGVAVEDRDRLFESFSQADASTDGGSAEQAWDWPSAAAWWRSWGATSAWRASSAWAARSGSSYHFLSAAFLRTFSAPRTMTCSRTCAYWSSTTMPLIAASSRCN